METNTGTEMSAYEKVNDNTYIITSPIYGTNTLDKYEFAIFQYSCASTGMYGKLDDICEIIYDKYAPPIQNLVKSKSI